MRFIILLGVFLLAAACTTAPRTATPPLTDYLNRTRPLVEARRYTEAVQVLEEAARRYPDSPRPLVAVGQIYLTQHRWLLAEDAFNRALVRQPDNPAAMAGLAETYFQQGRRQEAFNLWQKLTTSHSDWPGVFTGLGRVYLWKLDFDQARAAFLRQQEHQFDPEAAWYLAVLAAPLDLPSARGYLETLARLDDLPDDLLVRRDYLQETLAPFSTDTDPEEVAAAVGIAMAQVEQWPLAVHALRIARQANPANAQALAFLGHALARMGRPALDLFEQAHTLDPESAWPLYFEGIYLREQAAFGVAEDMFLQAIELDPDNAAFFVEFARNREQQGDLAFAEAALLRAVEISGNATAFRLILANFYAVHNYRLRDAGIPLAEAIIETDPDSAEAYDLLGWMQFLDGQAEAATRALQQAIELDPDLVSARYHLGRVLEFRGQVEPARAEYQRVIDWDLSGIYRDDALRALQRLKE